MNWRIISVVLLFVLLFGLGIMTGCAHPDWMTMLG